MGIKNDKLPLFLPATERNGILWILVFYKLEPYPYTTITEDDYEYILNHPEQYIVLYLMQKY
jgi:hypothetical protein